MSLLIKILIKELIIFDANTCPAHAKQMPNACKTREQREKIHTICPALAEPIYQKACPAHVECMPNACQAREEGENTHQTHVTRILKNTPNTKIRKRSILCILK